MVAGYPGAYAVKCDSHSACAHSHTRASTHIHAHIYALSHTCIHAKISVAHALVPHPLTYTYLVHTQLAIHSRDHELDVMDLGRRHARVKECLSHHADSLCLLVGETCEVRSGAFIAGRSHGAVSCMLLD